MGTVTAGEAVQEYTSGMEMSYNTGGLMMVG